MILPQNEVIGHSSRTDVHFRPAHLEAEWLDGGRRQVNIDPGYVCF
jgi:hypothetical protein